MVFGTKRQIATADSERFQLGPDEIRVTRDYKYLGCEASALMGKATAVIDRLVRVARFKGSDLSGPGGCRFNGVHAVRSINLWMAYVRPVLEYGVEIWKPTRLQAKKIESVLCDFARHALGVDRRTGNDVLLSELGLISLAARRDELRLRYLRHLCTMDLERTVAKVFRHRCEEVDAGRAKRSLCAEYRMLAQRYGLEEAWQTRPSDSASWSDWLPKVHQAVVKLDLKERKERLEQKVSATNYRVVKPLNRLSRSAYLYGRGLGVWLKLRLRVDNLPLLHVLARTAAPQWANTASRACCAAVSARTCATSYCAARHCSGSGRSSSTKWRRTWPRWPNQVPWRRQRPQRDAWLRCSPARARSHSCG
jgi:hypothetical protein